ncbi:MAG: HAMP domain-containing histidine kinase [Clostridiales bacterium]|nr:HAMP domain-containing histidine kinase [Candidatus Equinaster intestinalis]
MRFRFFKKVFLTVSCTILVTLTLSLAILGFVVSNYFLKEKYEQLDGSCRSVATIVLSDITSANFKRNVHNILRVQREVSSFDVLISDNSGKILVCGCRDYQRDGECRHSKKNIPLDVIAKTGNAGYRDITDLGGVFEDQYYVVSRAVCDEDGSVYGYVFSAASSRSQRNLLNTVTKMYILAVVIPFVIMFFAIYVMTYNYTKPLKMMSEAAKAMAKGDFSKRIPITSNDEIGELSVSFNNMTDSLSRLEQMRRSFIGNVSHELRTPMTTIAGFVDGILDGTIPYEKQEYYLKIVSDEVKRLSRVVKSMLELARFESGEVKLNPTRFNVSEQIVNVVLSREKQIEEKNIEIENLDNLPAAYINADYDLIYQVIYNLVDNAVKFTDENGKITFLLINTENSVQFSVRNTGKGIPKENLANIFEKFYKVDKSRSNNINSTGLGLYIVKTIIDIHGGKIVADSVQNEYTVFKILLPTENGGKNNG